MASIGDENLPLTSDFTYAQYSPPVITAPITNVTGDSSTTVTTINGNSGQATGPVITFSGGATGYEFTASSGAVTLSVANAATARAAISAAKDAINTDITQLNGASQVDVSGNYKVAGTQVVTAQQAAIPDAAGGVTVDTEARAALNTLLAELRTHGLIAP